MIMVNERKKSGSSEKIEVTSYPVSEAESHLLTLQTDSPLTAGFSSDRYLRGQPDEQEARAR